MHYRKKKPIIKFCYLRAVGTRVVGVVCPTEISTNAFHANILDILTLELTYILI